MEKLKAKISDLTVNQKIEIADYILQTFSQSDPEIEQAWKTEVQRRKTQVQTEEATLISGDQFDREVQEMKKRFSGWSIPFTQKQKNNLKGLLATIKTNAEEVGDTFSNEFYAALGQMVSFLATLFIIN